MKDNYDSIFTSIFSLDKISLILWLEGNNSQNIDLISNTWMYVSGTIPYFSKSRTNNIFKILKEKDIEVAPEENFRSLYLLLQEKIKDDIDGAFVDVDEDVLLNAIDKIEKDSRYSNIKLKEEIKNVKNVVEFKDGEISTKQQILNQKEEQIHRLETRLVLNNTEMIKSQKDAEIGRELQEKPIRTILKIIWNGIKQFFVGG